MLSALSFFGRALNTGRSPAGGAAGATSTCLQWGQRTFLPADPAATAIFWPQNGQGNFTFDMALPLPTRAPVVPRGRITTARQPDVSSYLTGRGMHRATSRSGVAQTRSTTTRVRSSDTGTPAVN